jgi:DNA-binding IclR family transcriptional regulator
LPRSTLVEGLKDRALELVKSSDRLVGVSDVARALKVSWATARAILLTLEAEGKVLSIRTPKGRLYSVAEKLRQLGLLK